MCRASFLLLLVCASICLGAPAAVADEFDDLAAELPAPGVAVVEFDMQSTVEERYFGHDGAGKSVTADTAFAYGSVSKSFTAEAVLALEEEGVVRTENPVASYLKELEGSVFAEQQVTVADLMRHTSGLPYNLDARNPLQYDVVSSVAALKKLTSRGEFRYSNVGYDLLQRVVERVSGQSFQEVLRRTVLLPAGIPDLVDTVERFENEVARAHAPFFGSTIPVASRPSAEHAGSGYLLAGTARELAAYGRWQLAQYSNTAEFGRVVEDGGGAYGPGLMYVSVTRADGSTAEVITHGGAMIGYSAVFYLDPEQRRGVVVLTNRLELIDGGTAQVVEGFALSRLGLSSSRESSGISLHLTALIGSVLGLMIVISGLLLLMTRWGCHGAVKHGTWGAMIRLAMGVGLWGAAATIYFLGLAAGGFDLPLDRVAIEWVPDVLLLLWMIVVLLSLLGTLIMVRVLAGCVVTKEQNATLTP